jgi:hypothetical protein
LSQAFPIVAIERGVSDEARPIAAPRTPPNAVLDVLAKPDDVPEVVS